MKLRSLAPNDVKKCCKGKSQREGKEGGKEGKKMEQWIFSFLLLSRSVGIKLIQLILNNFIAHNLKKTA